MLDKGASIVLSCIPPATEMHIGTYFGAIEKCVALQESHQCIYGIVDLDAMANPNEQPLLAENTERTIIDLIACGIDPQKSILFLQSLVPEQVELSWMLSCHCTYSELSRMTVFRKRLQRMSSHEIGDAVSAGLFTAPVLHAANILIYRAESVAVCKDQQEYVELSRNIAQRINIKYGTFFPEPRPLFSDTPSIMSLANPRLKMRKSLGPRHYIGLFESEHSIREKVGSAVTDQGLRPAGDGMSPGVSNLFNILRACGRQREALDLMESYSPGGRQHRILKEEVADALIETTQNLRAKRREWLDNAIAAKVRVLEMSEKAREIGRETLRSFRVLVGLPIRY